MDFSDFEYGSQPYTTSKIFDVHALSNEGFNKYIGPESYSHKYLNKITLKSLKSDNNSTCKVSKNDSCKISIINQKYENYEENKILKTKLKKIYKNQMLISQRKLKVITIQDGISALLLLYFEKFILKTENQIINAVIFSDYMAGYEWNEQFGDKKSWE